MFIIFGTKFTEIYQILKYTELHKRSSRLKRSFVPRCLFRYY